MGRRDSPKSVNSMVVAASVYVPPIHTNRMKPIRPTGDLQSKRGLLTMHRTLGLRSRARLLNGFNHTHAHSDLDLELVTGRSSREEASNRAALSIPLDPG